MDILTEQRRLEILRDRDRSRTWYSLDDERICIRCSETFTGHKIVVVPEADGSYELRCPTQGCDSTPVHWAYHGSGLGRPKASVRTSRAEIDFSNW